MTQTAIITGATGGIGKATCFKLAKRKLHLVLIARNKQKLEALADNLKDKTTCNIFPLDLSDNSAVKEAGEKLTEQYKDICVLINNGGGGMYEKFLDSDSAKIQKLVQVHYLSPALLIRAILPEMLERNYGRIINISSIAAEMGPWGHSGYAAAKAALATFTESLACEYSKKNVGFSIVKPGVIKTDFFNKPGYDGMKKTVEKHGIEPDRVAKVIDKMIDKPKLSVTVPRLYRAVPIIKSFSHKLAHSAVKNGSKPQNN